MADGENPFVVAVKMTYKEVVIDKAGKLISSRTPEDLPAFDQAIVDALK